LRSEKEEVFKMLKKKLSSRSSLCLIFAVVLLIPSTVCADVSVNVTVSGEMDGGIPNAQISVFDSDNDLLATTTSGSQGAFGLNFSVSIGDLEDEIYIYPAAQKTDCLDTYAPFWRIGKEEEPAKTISDVELNLLFTDDVAAVVTYLNDNPLAVNVDPGKGMVAGIIEIKIDNPLPGQDDLFALEGATVTWTDVNDQPVSANLIYFAYVAGSDEPGNPDPSLDTTSQSGVFLLYNIDLGGGPYADLIVKAEKEGYIIPDLRVRAFPYQQSKITFAPLKGTLGDTIIVSGIVKDATTNPDPDLWQPVPFAKVSAYDAFEDSPLITETTADKSGAFKLTGIERSDDSADGFFLVMRGPAGLTEYVDVYTQVFTPCTHFEDVFAPLAKISEVDEAIKEADPSVDTGKGIIVGMIRITSPDGVLEGLQVELFKRNDPVPCPVAYADELFKWDSRLTETSSAGVFAIYNIDAPVNGEIYTVKVKEKDPYFFSDIFVKVLPYIVNPHNTSAVMLVGWEPGSGPDTPIDDGGGGGGCFIGATDSLFDQD
jgi:hypothetical protein